MMTDESFAKLTLRDYFAACALQGNLASYSNSVDPEPEDASQKAYAYADAMLKERENDKMKVL